MSFAAERELLIIGPVVLSEHSPVMSHSCIAKTIAPQPGLASKWLKRPARLVRSTSIGWLTMAKTASGTQHQAAVGSCGETLDNSSQNLDSLWGRWSGMSF